MAACPACGSASPPGAKFCGDCGQSLETRVASERRPLTVMFCDLVGSTALAESLDPEDLADLVFAYQQTASTAVREFEGHVAQHLGDGLLVYFGYPSAHEDDARRAVFAGLGILDAISRLNEELDATRQLSVRIGIHTGPVVTGEVGSGATQERLALGSTPNVAARLQGIASPDTVVISADTHRLLKGACEVEALAPTALKGLSQPLSVYRVLARAQAFTPEFDVSRGLVGRSTESERLWLAFEAAQGGRGTTVLVTGEPGLGKSRLIHAFSSRIANLAAARWVVNCSPYEQASALRPVHLLLEQMFGIQNERRPAERLAALVGGLSRLGLSPADTVPVLANLLSLPVPAPFEPLDVTPPKRKAMAFEAIASLLVRSADARPAVWVIEDLHWADPSTIELLDFLLTAAANARLLIVTTARPTFTKPWGERVTSVTLGPVSATEARTIITQTAGGRSLPDRLVDQIVARADGVPLFVEELTYGILESGGLAKTDTGFADDDLSAVAIPTSLQASLTARLDRLGSAKEVAQLGSVIGREFAFDMLQAVAPWDEEVLRSGLRRLVESGLLVSHGVAPRSRYTFTHALVRDAAYEMLLKKVRRTNHGRVGRALVDRFPDVVAAQPELAAYHFTEAGDAAAAIPLWMTAGHRAAEASANTEAISHLQRALSLIATLPASSERDSLELGAHLALGPSLTLARGYVVDEVERTYLRAQELNERVGDPRTQFWIGFAIIQFRVIRGEIAEGLRRGELLVGLATSLGDPFCLARARCIQGVTSCYAAQFEASAHLMDQALEALPGPDAEFLGVTGMDLGTLIHVYQAWANWHLGRPDLAHTQVQAALDSADRTGRAHARGHGLIMAGATVSHFFGDVEAVRRYAGEAAELSARHGFPVWQLQAGLFMAWAQEATGTSAEKRAAADLSQALLAAYRSTGAKLTLSYFIALVAETEWNAGSLDRADALVDEALALGAEHSDPMWEAEIHRMKGELVLARRHGDQADAVPHFERALAVARRCGSRALESRAAASLTRLADAASGHRSTGV